MSEYFAPPILPYSFVNAHTFGALIMDDQSKAGGGASTINRFCSSHDFSRGHYYNLKKDGLGPAEIRIGRKIIITDEAAAAWRRKMERLTAEAAA